MQNALESNIILLRLDWIDFFQNMPEYLRERA